MAHAAERGLVWTRRWLGAGGLDAGADWVVDPVPLYAERDLRKYLERDIPAHGFARANFILGSWDARETTLVCVQYIRGTPAAARVISPAA